MVIVGLDVATHTGIAIIREDQVCLKTLDSSKHKGVWDRNIFLWQSIKQLLDKYNPDWVFIEGLAWNVPNKNTLFFLAVLQIGICISLHKEKIPFRIVPPTTIKKYITKNGRASKQKVFDVLKELGYSMKTYDEADALALALYGLSELKKESCFGNQPAA